VVRSRIQQWEQQAAGGRTSAATVETLLSEALDDFDGDVSHATTAATPDEAAATERGFPPFEMAKTERSAQDAVEARVAASTAATPEQAAAMERAPVQLHPASTAATPDEAVTRRRRRSAAFRPRRRQERSTQRRSTLAMLAWQ
jgi:hypothetical protein